MAIGAACSWCVVCPGSLVAGCGRRSSTGPSRCPTGSAAACSKLTPSGILIIFALLTDIGNDIAYGVEPAKIAGWIDLVLGCLSRLGARTAMTLLPLASLRRLSPAKLQILRFLFFPTHPTSHECVQRWTADLQDRLRDLAARYEVPALEPDPDWFGPDPIHYRRNARREAWRQVLGLWRERSTEQGGAEVASTGAVSRMSRLRWWTTTPERWSLAGMQRGRQQPAGRLDEGTTLWLY